MVLQYDRMALWKWKPKSQIIALLLWLNAVTIPHYRVLKEVQQAFELSDGRGVQQQEEGIQNQ